MCLRSRLILSVEQAFSNNQVQHLWIAETADGLTSFIDVIETLAAAEDTRVVVLAIPQDAATELPVRSAALSQPNSDDVIYATPGLVAAIIVSIVLVLFLLCAVQCLMAVQAPSKFALKALPAGKEF